MSELASVTGTTFRSEVLQCPLPVLVDFYATWCSPCRVIAPIVEEVARDHREHLKVVRLNVDEHPDITMAYGVMGLPTLLLFVGGKPALECLGGYVTKEQVESYLAQNGAE